MGWTTFTKLVGSTIGTAEENIVSYDWAWNGPRYVFLESSNQFFFFFHYLVFIYASKILDIHQSLVFLPSLKFSHMFFIIAIYF
jgi:hypothetical protein